MFIGLVDKDIAINLFHCIVSVKKEKRLVTDNLKKYLKSFMNRKGYNAK